MGSAYFPAGKGRGAFFGGKTTNPPPPPPPPPRQGGGGGGGGWIRRLAETNELTIYRPFPDLETAEVVVIHELSRHVLGIQVKTIGVDNRHPRNLVDIDMTSSGRRTLIVVSRDKQNAFEVDQIAARPKPYRRPLDHLGRIMVQLTR